MSKQKRGQKNDHTCSDDELDDIADEEAYMEFLATGTNEKLKDTNDNWNSIHVQLRKSLE